MTAIPEEHRLIMRPWRGLTDEHLREGVRREQQAINLGTERESVKMQRRDAIAGRLKTIELRAQYGVDHKDRLSSKEA